MGEMLIYQLLERIGNLLRAQQRLLGSDFGLQEVHLQVLLYLCICNRYSDTPIGVSEYLNATKGTVSQSVKVLEKKGYLRKQADQNDKRMVHLILTNAGREIVTQVIPPPLFVEGLKGLTSQQTEQMQVSLSILLSSLQKANRLRSFGVCQTCRFFTSVEDGYMCGLTQELLSQDDSSRICREHEEGN